MRTLGPVLLALAIPVYAHPPQIIHANALPVVTLEEVAALPPPPPKSVIREHERARQIAFMPPVTEAASSAPTLAPPALGLEFKDETEPSDIRPADASGAVGKSRVVGVNNKSVWVHTHDGHSLAWAYLDNFFSTRGSYDPRIVYDTAVDRWVIVAMRDDGEPNYLNSKLLIAISDSGDPMGSWHRYPIPVDHGNSVDGDYPQVALARDRILITMNMFDNFTGAAVGAVSYSILRSDAYSGSPSLALAQAQPIGLQYLTPVSVADATNASTWYIYDDYAGLHIYDAQTNDAVQQVRVPVDTASFCCGLGAQLGSNILMDVGLELVHYATIRDHKLWTVQNFTPGPGAFAAVLVVRVDLGTYAVDTWVIKSNDTAYTFPSIAVNKFGAALVAFSQFNASIYPSAAYTYIAPNGDWSAPTTLKSGEGPYTIQRWGDFTTTVVDPADDTSFWTTQVIALAKNPYATWSTWWAQIPIAPGVLKQHAAKH